MLAYSKTFNGLWWFLVLTVGLVACTPPVVPETPKQRLGAAYATYAGVTNAFAGLVEGGQISKDAAKDVQRRLQDVRKGLDTSSALVLQGTPETDAEAIQMIQGMLLILNQLSAELAAQEGS